MELDLSAAALEPRLAAFLAHRHGAGLRLSDWQRFPAGFSWITIGFRAQAPGRAAEELILRMGDPRGLLAPYRSEPEFRAMQLLQGVPALPLPTVHAFCDDTAVIGGDVKVTAHLQLAAK